MDKQFTNQELLGGFCRRHGYQEELPVLDENDVPTGETTPNPETKVEFYRRRKEEMPLEQALEQLAKEAREQARLQAQTEFEAKKEGVNSIE